MESNIKGLVSAGHEMASELKAECGAVDMRSVAKLISDLATQLEVQLVRANALASENARLKAGAMYFSYGSEFSFECHKTAEEAIAAAEAAIDDYRGDACDGWSEEVESICWGIIMQSSTKVGERPRNEDDCCDPAIDTICNYALLPDIETPATDAFLAEVRAQGVEMAACALDNVNQFNYANMLDDLAQKIRKGVQS
ncbi:TPA: hypothetical protein JS165_000839 [Escherichia coli]|nr:hypothetical protein [Escherichia coli]